MNELLGWYGYDNAVDSDDTQDLDLNRFSSGSTAGTLNRLKLVAAAAAHARAVASKTSRALVTRDAIIRDTPSNGSCESPRGVDSQSPGTYIYSCIILYSFYSDYLKIRKHTLQNVKIIKNKWFVGRYVSIRSRS